MYPLSLPTLICIVSKAFLTETLREDSRHRGDSPPKKITMTILKKGWDKYFRISLNAAKEVDKCLVMCILPRPHQCRRSPRTFPAPPHSPHSPGQWLVKAPISLHLVVLVALLRWDCCALFQFGVGIFRHRMIFPNTQFFCVGRGGTTDLLDV